MMTNKIDFLNSYHNAISLNTNKINSPTQKVGTDFSTTLQNVVESNQSNTNSLDKIFERAATTYHVPLNLLKAVAKTESNFNPNATSRCGAKGIMQLMPGTAKSLGVTDPFDAEQNIMGGARMLGSLLDRYHGDAKLALAAYNAGSGNVQKYGGVPPFKETKCYIERVMKYAGEDVSIPENSFSANTLQNNNFFNNNRMDSTQGFEYSYDDYMMFLQVILAQIQANMSDTSNLGAVYE